MNATTEQVAAFIRKEWFANHKATVITTGDTTTIQWAQPSTSMYSVTYILHENKIFITGDIGDAVFRLTWQAGIHTFNDLSSHEYFLSKLTASSRERWGFDYETAMDDINDWAANDPTNETMIEMKNELLDIAQNSGTLAEYTHRIYEHYENQIDYAFDTEDYAHFATFGQTTPDCFVAYLVGLQMISEQLKGKTEK